MNNLSLAFNTTFVGLTVVFLSLILLAIIIVFSRVLRLRKGSPKHTPHHIKDDEFLHKKSCSSPGNELIAVITAAILSSMKTSPGCKIRVGSIRRIPQSSPVWNLTGRSEYLAGKL